MRQLKPLQMWNSESFVVSVLQDPETGKVTLAIQSSDRLQWAQLKLVVLESTTAEALELCTLLRVAVEMALHVEAGGRVEHWHVG